MSAESNNKNLGPLVSQYRFLSIWFLDNSFLLYFTTLLAHSAWRLRETMWFFLLSGLNGIAETQFRRAPIKDPEEGTY